MPIILVVDDSEVDRKLVGGLLRRDIDWLVEFADNGQTAVAMIRDISPDIVVTDLQMPEMDGMQLCKIGREKFPHIPIILITGKGSERLAVEALHAGAASYVPKNALAETLVDTVQQMLVLKEKDKSKDRLMHYTTNCRYQFKMESDATLIPPLVDFVCSSMKLMHLGDTTQIRHVAIAIEEALLNAIYHGNLELRDISPRGVRISENGEVADLIESRLKVEPYKDRTILFGMDLARNKAQFVIRDGGPGFDVQEFVHARRGQDMSNEKQRGLTLIRNFMDDVSFNETGNEIRMTLNL
jgi:CheY-like chemotaxis protein/anti-sigma regulatory factor (Ser/Thr protein kinase)